jgi:hypothetical protein
MFWIAVLSNQNGGLSICLALDNSKASTLSGKLCFTGVVAVVVQLVRAPACDAGSCGFKSRRSPHFPFF